MWRIHIICVYLWKYQCKFPIPKWAIGSLGVNKNDFIEYVFTEEKRKWLTRLRYTWTNDDFLKQIIRQGVKSALKEKFIKIMNRADWRDRIRLTDDKGIQMEKFFGLLEFALGKYNKSVAFLLGGGGVVIIWIIVHFLDFILDILKI